MDENVQKNYLGKKILNLGCGFAKIIGAVNVDAYDICNPDITWDLNQTPYTWANENDYDLIIANHVFEHLDNWWDAFCECARILKPNGLLEIHVPHHSSISSNTYRDHKHVFSIYSFHGTLPNEILPESSYTNAWAKTQEYTVPFRLIEYRCVPYKKYNWMIRWCPRLLAWCADHLRGFIWEQCFIFRKEVIHG